MFDQVADEEDVFGRPLRAAPNSPAPEEPPAPEWGATVGDRTVAVSPEVQALFAAIAALEAQKPIDLSPEQALADTAGVLDAMSQLKLVALERVGDVEARRLHRMDGSPTTNSWLRRHDHALSQQDIALSRRLPSLPTVAAAVADRSIGAGAAARISTALAKLRRWVDRPDGLIDGQDAHEALQGVIVHGVRDQVCQALGGLEDDDPRLAALLADVADVFTRPESEVARLEAAFVLLAQHVEPDLLPGALGMLVDALLPNELERRAGGAHSNRGFGLKPTPDGSGWFITDSDLDLELGELLFAVLQAEMRVDPSNIADTDAYRAARADGWTDADGTDGLPGGAEGPRSRRQRQHDALKQALRRLLDSGALGTRDKVAPHINVTTGLDWMHDGAGAAPAVGDSGVRLPRSLVRAWWCESAVSRFVLSLGRKVIEASHTERTLKSHERRAKVIETGGRCEAAGCRCGPWEPLIPHHPKAFARTGITSKDDTAWVCRADHHRIHSGETIRLRGGRLLNEHGWVTREAA